jgi:hypothetical protein
MRISASNTSLHTDIGVANATNDFVNGALKGDFNIKNTTGCNIHFANSQTSPVMTINSNNNVGIGTTSPAYKFDVSGISRISTTSAGLGALIQNSTLTTGTNQNITLSIGKDLSTNNVANVRYTHRGGDGSTNNYVGYGFWGNDDILNIQTSGNVGIGTTSPTQKLHVVGNIFATGDIVAFSDKRLKSNIKIIDNALSRVHQLNGYTFDVHGDTTNKRHTGLIAQEVKKILPEAVYKNVDDEMYSIAYGNISGLIVQAIKELDDRYKKQLNTMKKKVRELQIDIRRYKKTCKRHAF